MNRNEVNSILFVHLYVNSSFLQSEKVSRTVSYRSNNILSITILPAPISSSLRLVHPLRPISTTYLKRNNSKSIDAVTSTLRINARIERKKFVVFFFFLQMVAVL